MWQETLGEDRLPPPFIETTTQESGLRENCTSRLSERAEAGRKPHLSRLYTRRTGEPFTGGSGWRQMTRSGATRAPCKGSDTRANKF